MRGWPDVDVSGKSSECRPWSSLNCIPSAIAMHADQLIVWSGGARPSTVSGTPASGVNTPFHRYPACRASVRPPDVVNGWLKAATLIGVIVQAASRCSKDRCERARVERFGASSSRGRVCPVSRDVLPCNACRSSEADMLRVSPSARRPAARAISDQKV